MTQIKPILLCSILLFCASCSDKVKRADTNTQPTANNKPSEPAAEKKTPDRPTLDAHKTLKKLSESARAYYAEPMSVAVPTPEQSAKKTGEPASDAWKALDFAMTDPHYYAYNFVADSEQPLSVFIDAAGKISIDGKAIKPSQLTKRLQKEREKNPSLQLIIHADKKTLHGQVVTVMDAAKRAGVEKIAIKQQGEEDNSALTPPAN